MEGGLRHKGRIKNIRQKLVSLLQFLGSLLVTTFSRFTSRRACLAFWISHHLLVGVCIFLIFFYFKASFWWEREFFLSSSIAPSRAFSRAGCHAALRSPVRSVRERAFVFWVCLSVDKHYEIHISWCGSGFSPHFFARSILDFIFDSRVVFYRYYSRMSSAAAKFAPPGLKLSHAASLAPRFVAEFSFRVRYSRPHFVSNQL